ncbi:MAG: TSUP family transporter, partial [Propionibacteriaceae bacterium]|nr:TSUP family transporter [Propionibacteriaceae bacterium]
GLGLVSAPFLMWAIPDAMPGALIVLAAGMTLTTLVNHVRWIEWPALGWGTLGRLPGVALGTWLVVVLSLDALGVIVGAAVLVAVALQRSRWQIQKNRTNLLLAGTLSGAMGTATGIGGPPMAMVMARITMAMTMAITTTRAATVKSTMPSFMRWLLSLS